MPTHAPVNGVVHGAVLQHVRGDSSALAMTPDWWGKLGNGGDTGTILNYADIRFPISNAIAPDQRLPRGYGAVRVGGTAIARYSPFSNDLISGAFLIAWLEGPIAGIDAFLCNGSPITAYSYPQMSRGFAHYYGAAGEPGAGGFSAMPGVAFTDIQLRRDSMVGGQWWILLPQGSDSLTFEWAADVRGLKLYDPRTGLAAYSNNPVLIVRDLLQLFSIPVNDTIFSAAATASETAGFSCNIVFAKVTPLAEALAIVLQTCNGTLTDGPGGKGISLDLPIPGDPVAILSEENGDIWDLKYEWLSARDRVTRMAVSFPNSAANWKQDQTPDFDDPGIALGTVPIKPLVVNAPGITTLDAAVILRDYLFNRQAVRFRVSGTMNSRGLLLREGDKIHLDTFKCSVDVILEQIPTDAQGFFSFVGKPYDADVWSTTPLTQGPPLDTGAGDRTPPPPPAAVRWVFGAGPDTTGVAFDPPRDYSVAGPYGSARWTVTDDASHDAAKINDENKTVAAITTADTTMVAVVLDLGAGVTAKIGRFDFWTDAVLDYLPGSPPPLYDVAYSDDGSTWVSTGDLFPWSDAPVGGIYPQHIECSSAAVGTGHRYWRLHFYSVTAFHVYEIQASTFTDWAGTPAGYELRTWTSFGPADMQSVVLFTPTLPTDSAPLPLPAPLATTTGDAFGGWTFVFAAQVTTRARVSSVTATPGAAYAAIAATFTGGGGAPVRIHEGAGITGTINDSNATFTTSVNVSVTTGFLVVVDGAIDFAATWVGTTLTSSPPHSGISVLYWS